VYNHCGTIKEALACNKMEIDGKERGLEPSGPRSADKLAWVACGCTIVTSWPHDLVREVPVSLRLWGYILTWVWAPIWDAMRGPMGHGWA